MIPQTGKRWQDKKKIVRLYGSIPQFEIEVLG